METVHAAGVTVPVEQSPLWAGYDGVLPGREHWRYLIARDGNRLLAAISLTTFAGRVLEQLWAKQGPIWLGGERSAQSERAFRDALVDYIRAQRPRAGVLRLHAEHEANDLAEPLIGVFYDRTVVLDLSKPEDQLLAEMSQSGRRNIRKAMKNEDLVFNDETSISEEEFRDVIYPVFQETGERGGFFLRPSNFYYEMLRRLGPQACRLFTVRHEGAVISWALVTVYDGQANYYYAASTATARKHFAAYLMAWQTMRTMKAEGVAVFDFLGCGSARVPGLDTLNEFKLSFAKNGLLDVPGPWDVVLRPSVMRAYHLRRQAITGVAAGRSVARKIITGIPRTPGQAVGLVDAASSAAAAKVASKAPVATPGAGSTPAVLPVVLDFTLSGYALARAFHERYNLTSAALVPFQTRAIADSEIFHDVRELGREALSNPDMVLKALRRISTENPSLTVIPLTNNDELVQAMSAARDTLGKNVVVPHENPQTLRRVSDKNEFNDLCATIGVPTPRTHVIDFADGHPAGPGVNLGWPIILKPADSGLYNALPMPGKEKLYKLTGQIELEKILNRLSAAGFTGQMLAQEFIPGAALLSVTLYRASTGQITLARASRVLAQDPRPAYLGIPDVQVVDQIPDVIEASTRILEAVNYRGFANLDAIRDPRNGRVLFFEVNPRFGRNCFYATASGANIAEQLVTDLVNGAPVQAPALDGKLLYSTLPPAFLSHYLRGTDREEVRALVRNGQWADPLRYPGEPNPKHRLYATVQAWNHARVYRSAPATLGS
ncbi:MAG: GNAT family N-acetyltransferase [Actinomycetota bacterium]|nr:GNAT family N-acetyltransferase [Actinomycetota bacterium]